MIVTITLLFIFGTSVIAEPLLPALPTDIIIEKHHHREVDYLPSSGASSPFISNFIQKGTNVFFKPQFMLSSGQMPPQIQSLIATIEKEDCKTDIPIPTIIEEPLRIIEKEIIKPPRTNIKEVIEIRPVIPAAPVLPTLEIPELPCVIEEQEIILEPAAPAILIEEIPEVVSTPLIVPPAPVLPPLEMPKLPFLIQEPEVVLEPLKPVVIEPIVVPPAPVLPPLEIPCIPVVIEESLSVVEPSLTIIEKEPEYIGSPVVIPSAPILPPLVIPAIPEVEVVIPPVDPVIIEEVKPVVIPQPPVLPPFSMPEVPVKVLIEEHEMALPCDNPIIEVNEIIEPKIIPEAPILPPMPAIEIPAPVVIEEPAIVTVEQEYIKPAFIPPAPVLPALELPKVSVLVEETAKPCPEKEVIKAEIDYVNSVVVEPKPIFVPIPVAFQSLSARPMEILSVPAAPVAPEWLVPYIPESNKYKEVEKWQAASPSSCVHDIVVERILPKMEKALQYIPSSPSVPVPAAYLPPLSIKMF